jgi:hypothetical protein
MENKIDRVFKEKLGSYASMISPGLWDGIDTAMVKQRRRKRLLLALLVFVFISSLLMIYYTFEHESQEENRDTLNNEQLASNLFSGSANIKDLASQGKDDDAALIRKEPVSNSWAHEVSYETADLTVSSEDSKLINKRALFDSKNRKVFQNAKETMQVTVSGFKSHNLDPYRCNIFPDKLPQEEIYQISYKSLSSTRTKTLGDCFDGPPNRFMLGFNASMDFPFRSINGADGGDLVNYVRQRNQTESEFISFNAGLQAGYFHSSGFLIRGGLQYTQINERFLFVKENVVKIQTQITIDTMINSDGSYTITRDTSISEIIGREEMKTSNHFKMLDIPLVFGYTFDLRKFSLELNGGLIFNVTSKSGGRILNTEFVPSYYGAKGSSFQPYKTYFGLSLYGSLTVLSNFYGNTQFFIEPNARYYLRSFSSPDYPIRQKYIVIGLSTGARYYF